MTPRQAFWAGFIKGLAAPAGLFGRGPRLALAPIVVEPVTVQRAGIAADWRRVGDDIRAAGGMGGDGTVFGPARVLAK